MIRFSGITVVLVALLLIVTTVQCAASCTPISKPVCPHHKQKPAACAQELVPATTVPTTVLDALFTPEAAIEPLQPTLHLAFDPTFIQNYCPPPARVISNLRI